MHRIREQAHSHPGFESDTISAAEHRICRGQLLAGGVGRAVSPTRLRVPVAPAKPLLTAVPYPKNPLCHTRFPTRPDTLSSNDFRSLWRSFKVTSTVVVIRAICSSRRLRPLK